MICRPNLFREDDDDAETGFDGDEEREERVLLDFTRPDCRDEERDEFDEFEDFDDEFDDDFEDELGDEYGFESDEVPAVVREAADADEFDDLTEL